LGERLGASLQHAETGVLRDFYCVPYNKNQYKKQAIIALPAGADATQA
jgi:hypothetical protein